MSGKRNDYDHWNDHERQNIARIRDLLATIDRAERVGDADFDAAYFGMQQWVQYTSSGPSVPSALQSLAGLYERDRTEAGLHVANSRLRRVIVAELEQRERSLASSVARREHQGAPDVPPESGEGTEVFMSYSHLDEELASEIYDLLVSRGLQVFRATTSIQAGEIWSDSIRSALLRARAVVLVLTRNSQSADWVLGEIGACWVLGKPLVPALLDVTMASMPEFVSRSQGISIVTAKQRNQLAERVAALVAAPNVV